MELGKYKISKKRDWETIEIVRINENAVIYTRYGNDSEWSTNKNAFHLQYDIEPLSGDNKINDLLIEERLHERISDRLTVELKRQKASGKEFISNEEIDVLIDKVMNDEIENSTKITLDEWAEKKSKELKNYSAKYCLIEGFEKAQEIYNNGK